MTSSRKRVKESPQNDDGRVIIVTSRDRRVLCHPIVTEMEAQEENIRAQFEWPDVPQRKIDVPPDAGADWPSTMDLTQEHIDTDYSTEEEQALWAKYLEAKKVVDTEFTAKLTENKLRLMALRGITILDMPPEDEWVEEHAWMGMDVPENRLDRLLHYFRTEVLGTMDDVFAITKGIYRSAGLDQEVLDEFERSFRDQVGRARREALKSDQKDAGGEPGEIEEEAEGLVG